MQDRLDRNTLVLPSPAKLNLMLHILGRREDGYHELQTLFQFLDYGDEMTFAVREDGVICLHTEFPGVAHDDNLIVKAAKKLQAQSACPLGIDIWIKKILPMGGGIGGGSSNAATTLLALNHLWQLGLSRQRLQEIGLTLGADVPVFLFGSNAFAEGVGEALQALTLPPAWYVVLEPPVQVPTALIFGSPELKRDTPPLAASDWRPGTGSNDLQAVACARFPIIATYLEWLGRYGEARMSGSGACVFAGFPDEQQARRVLEDLPAGMRGWVAAGLDEHPLRVLAD